MTYVAVRVDRRNNHVMVDFCVAAKRADNTSPERQDFDGDRLKAGLSPDTVHGPQEVEHLSTNRGIWFEWYAIKHHCEAFDGSVWCHVEEPSLEFQIVSPFDFNMSMPFGVAVAGLCSASSAIADGIAANLQRCMSHIVN